MELSKSILSFIFLLLLPMSHGATSNLFREYIGADLKAIKFSDVPINPNIDFHFILSFAIDYTNSTKYSTPTNGKFNVFWYTEHLGPANVAKLKSLHKNVRVAVSLGGDVVTKNQYAYFAPNSISSWVSNAVTSLTQIIKLYNLDGIDIDYEHFSTDPDTFAECIGQLITILKRDGIISFASIAPYEDDQVQSHYQSLWRKYGHVIDYVNFQFYAHDDAHSVDQFIGLFDRQLYNYNGGRLLAGFATDPQAAGRFTPGKGFITACGELKKEGKLGGIFVWCADDSKKNGYRNEEWCQELLASE